LREKPNRDFLIGKWGTDGDFEPAVDLRADGSSDGPRLVDVLDLKVVVTVVDNAILESTNRQGEMSTMTRLP